jgi:hypothetical protein
MNVFLIQWNPHLRFIWWPVDLNTKLRKVLNQGGRVSLLTGGAKVRTRLKQWKHSLLVSFNYLLYMTSLTNIFRISENTYPFMGLNSKNGYNSTQTHIPFYAWEKKINVKTMNCVQALAPHYTSSSWIWLFCLFHFQIRVLKLWNYNYSTCCYRMYLCYIISVLILMLASRWADHLSKESYWLSLIKKLRKLSPMLQKAGASSQV